MVDTDDFKIDQHCIMNFFSKEKAEEISRQNNMLRLKETQKINSIILKALPHMSTDLEIVRARTRKHSLNNGSLYKMFISDVFTMDMVMIYLDLKKEKTIIDTLINLMYSKYIHQSFFYLPQLCVMFNYKNYTESLENYLLDRCINQMKFSIIVTWLMNSYSEDGEIMKQGNYDNLVMKIEETLVNGNRGNYSTYVMSEIMNSNDVYKNSVNKEIRMQYFYYVNDFYGKLKEMCEDLKNYQKTDRKKELDKKLTKINEDIYAKRNECKEYLFYGIVLPFDDGRSTNDSDNNLIVRFVKEESFCFSTKMRVPSKVCVECVRVEECKNWDKLYIKEEEKETDSNNEEISTEKLVVEEDHNSKIKDEAQRDKRLKEFMDNINKNNDPQGTHHKKLSSNLELTNIADTITLEKVFGEPLEEVKKRIKTTSSFRNFSTYDIKSFIAKADDDLRQEHLAMQLIKSFDEIFKSANLPLKLRPYEICITSSSSGLLEFLSNTNSIDGIKKTIRNLNTFYRTIFKDNFEQAQKNFVESLAAYSLICYYIQIKDRHNGNILIDMYGNIIHIDFGFILGISPGNLNFESAPFKLTLEYLEIMDGDNSNMYKYFRELMIKGMIESKKHVESIVKMVEIMSHGSKMPCFNGKDVTSVIDKFRERFYERKNDSEFGKIVDELIYKAKDNFWTNKYDYFQKITNGIIP